MGCRWLSVFGPTIPGRCGARCGRLGARVRPLPVVRGRRTLTVDEFLAHIEAGRYSWTWQATDECRREATRKLRVWLARRFGDLARPVEPQFAVEWWAFDLPDRVVRAPALGSTTMEGSVAFDRAAEYYDRTRGEQSGRVAEDDRTPDR